METNSFKNWWESKDHEIRRDPIESAQQMIQRPVSTEEVYQRAGLTQPVEPTRPDYVTMDEVPPETIQTTPIAEEAIKPEPADLPFDPEGKGYDMKSAESVGMQSEIDPEDGLPHYGSVIEATPEQKEQYGLPDESYMILKGRQHDTWDKAVKGEEERGFEVKKFGDRYFSVPSVTTEPMDKEEPIQEKQIQPKEPVTRGGEKKVMMEEDRYVVNTAYEQLNKYEGKSGDTTGAAKTGKRGLTEEQYERQKLLAKDPELTEEQASKNYLTQLYTRFDRDVEGFSELSNEVKADIIHEAYNLGPSMTKYPSFTKAIKENNVEQIFFHLLDTANISGETSKGIAVRRAELYNKYADAKIKTVEQLEDGTLIYSTEDGELFRYKRAKHKSSKAGKVKL